jgi:probable phosphoglycerate mutase
VYRLWNEQPDTVCPPDGETLQSARHRLQKVLDRLVKKHKSGSVAVVLPPPMANLLQGMLRDDQVTEIWKCPSKNGPLWEPIPMGVPS